MVYPLSEKDIFPYRPKPFYFITSCNQDELTVEEFKKKLRHLKKIGFGGIMIFNKPMEGFNAEKYLSEDWFKMIENAAIACRDLELDMWINDGFDYPPGDVAGKIEALSPELKQQRIKLKNGNPFIEEVSWGFPAFEEIKSGELFRSLVYDQYEKHVGKYFNDPITTFFSDTDNRRVQPSVMFKNDSAMRDYFPWASDFETSFMKKYGYNIMPYMIDVLLRKYIKQAEDYWEHAGTLYQRWHKGNHQWMKDHGLKYTGHSSDSSPYLQTDAPRSSCFTEGRFSDVQNNWDYPGTDQELYAIDGGKHMVVHNFYCPNAVWGNTLNVPKMTKFADVSEDLRAKQAAATAFMYGKKGVMCEMFAASNFDVEPKVLKHIAAFQLMQGVTHVIVSAYMHRFLDQIKYFAPPEYSENSLLQHSMDVINKEIAQLACILNRGKDVFPIVMIDPTEFVWRNEFDSKAYFETFSKLNRLPYGFTICDTDKILKNDYGFKVAIYSGINLKSETIIMLQKKGIVVISDKEIEKLHTYIDCDIHYSGEGTPHFIRKIIDNEEFTFIGNIESEQPIKGTIRAYGREKKITLFPGDVRYISKSFDDIPDEEKSGKTIYRLDEVLPVEFDRPNLIQMEYFTDNGLVVDKLYKNNINFQFKATDCLKSIKLYIPFVRNIINTTILNENSIYEIDGTKNIVDEVSFNGKQLSYTYGKVFDEAYRIYNIPIVKRGINNITIKKNSSFESYNRLILEGDFDAFIKSEGIKEGFILNYYNMTLSIPEKAEITLKNRSKAVKTNLSVALQGQPFYSGGITYKFSVNIEESGDYRLKFPDVNDVGLLYINGDFVEKIVKPPYTYNFSLTNGKNDFVFTVYNSIANAMAGFLEPGGIISGAILEKL